MAEFRRGILFVSWAPFCSRSDSIANRLGGKSFMVYAAKYGSHYATVPFNYVAQTLRTLRLLFGERPAAVFVMTPPVTACIPVWIYSRVTGAPFVIDAHTGAFVDPRWKRILFLHKWFSRAARTTIVTNEYMRDIVKSWGAGVTIVRDVPVVFADPDAVRFDEQPNMTLVCTFTPDEPIGTFLEAALQLPDIRFHVTGDYRRAPTEVIAKKPPNVTMTGFLSSSQYVGLLLASDAIICLTTRDHTMQRGAYEAMYLGRPVITSDFDLLRKHFYKGCVHVDGTVDGLVSGIVRMRDGIERYRGEIAELRVERLEEWKRVEAELRRLIGGVSWSAGY